MELNPRDSDITTTSLFPCLVLAGTPQPNAKGNPVVGSPLSKVLHRPGLISRKTGSMKVDGETMTGGRNYRRSTPKMILGKGQEGGENMR